VKTEEIEISTDGARWYRAVHVMHKRFLDVLMTAVFSSFGLTFDSGYKNLQRGSARNSYHDLFQRPFVWI